MLEKGEQPTRDPICLKIMLGTQVTAVYSLVPPDKLAENAM
jgi:hypothetical protein